MLSGVRVSFETDPRTVHPPGPIRIVSTETTSLPSSPGGLPASRHLTWATCSFGGVRGLEDPHPARTAAAANTSSALAAKQLFVGNLADRPGRVPHDDRARLDVLEDHGPGADEGLLTDLDPGK